MTGVYLLLLVGLTSVMSLVTAARSKAYDWVLVNGGFAAAAAAGYFVAPERAGAWLIGPFLLFAIAPLIAVMQVNRLVVARRARWAGVLARIAFVLHPSAAHRRLVRINDAYLLAADGNVEAAATILRETGHAQDMELEMLRLHNQWPEIIAFIEAATPTPLEHGSAVMYIRALGETGQLDRFVDAYRDASTRWASVDHRAEDLATIRLFAAAFLGQPALVDEMFAGSLRHFSPSIQQFWRAMAHDAGGDRERAKAIWAELAHDEEARTRNAAEFRAGHPSARIDAPSEAMRAVIAQLASDIRDTATYAPAKAKRAVLSYAIVAVLVAVHAYVTWKQRTDPRAIYDLGVFWSPAVLDDGEWWRVATAVFLHASWMHLAMNVLGLVWFGPFVERFLGRTRFAIVFLLGGIGGFAVLAAFAALGIRDATAALGASGAVMALIGASIGIFFRGSARSPVAAKRLREMLGFVGVQVVFDILAPRVSMTAHVAGLAIGALLGFVIASPGSAGARSNASALRR